MVTRAAADPRRLGMLLLLLVSALFSGAFLYMCTYARLHLEAWPDVAGQERVSDLYPLGAALGLLLAALSWNLGLLPRAAPLLLLGAVAALLATLHDAGRKGWFEESGRYGVALVGGLVILGLHVMGALLAVTISRMRGGSGANTPLLRLYLAYAAGLGIVASALLFLP